MGPVGIEIERKYRLRAAPDPVVLRDHGAVALRLEQVYLAGEPPGRRVRRIQESDGTVEHRLTRKERLRDFAFREEERVIDADEFEALLAQADPSCRWIRKIRHVVPHGTQKLEIDVFEVPAGLVLLEVELATDDEVVELPGWLDDWVDVTGDPAYLNANLARSGSVLPDWDPA
jgi:CYTH domain-containing protein